MIQFVNVVLKVIFIKGRNFLWQRPNECPRCANWKVWGHGHVQCNFEGFSVQVPDSSRLSPGSDARTVMSNPMDSRLLIHWRASSIRS